MKVVVLAGGKGTRLGLEGVPKPMVLVDGVPLLERLVDVAKQSGFTEFVFLNGYLGEVIEAHFGDGSSRGVTIEHLTEKEPLGTAGAVLMAKALLDKPFVVLYGDILIDVDLRHFADFALKRGGAGSLFVHPNDHPHDSDLLEVDQNDRIVSVYPKPHPPGLRLPNIVSAALYVLFPKALDFVDEGQSLDWGRDIFPRIAKKAPLYAYRSIEYAKDIGTPERLKKAESHMRAGRLKALSRTYAKPAVFLDRDGVINVERGGIFAPGELNLIEGAAEAICKLNAAGIPAICVTNQPALAKGQMSWADLRAVSAELDCQLAEGHAYLDDIYVCPHHPELGFKGEVSALKIVCSCRKPRAGMLHKARKFHNLDLSRSWLIGDRYCDVKAAQRTGARAVLVKTGHAGNDHALFPRLKPDAICKNLLEAVDYILDQS